MENDSFVFYPSFYEALEGLPDEAYLRLSKCIISYGVTGLQTDLVGYEKNIFATIKAQIDANFRKKKHGEKGAEYGKKGGRPPKDENPTPLFDETPYPLEGKPHTVSDENPIGVFLETPNENENENDKENGNDNDKENENENPEETGKPLEELTPSKTFITVWQKNSDVFNLMARIEQPKEWEAFWSKCNYSPQEVETMLNNFCEAVRKGIIEERYVAATPDRFVLKGWLQKSRNPFQPKATSPPPKKGPDWGGAVPMGTPVKAKSFFEGGDK